MGEIIIAVVAKIAEYLVDPIIGQARYLLRLRKFEESLRNEKTQLESAQERVEERAKATKRTEEITGAVKKWMKDAKDILQEVQELERRVEEAKNKCFSVSSRYALAKQVERRTRQMLKLSNECNFEPFSFSIEVRGYFSSKDFVYFKSTESACNEILKAVEYDRSNMIGLYGMGGSGKTSLAKEVAKIIEESKLYDKVIMAVVSQPLKIENIQDQISDLLGFKFDEQSMQGRAQRLSQALSKGRTLIILDDVWEYINLEEIGIWSEVDKGYCVLLTTRNRRVCESMGCQSIIELSLLTDEEAWALFKQNANITNDFPNEMERVARNIADECKGLPIAIVIVGRMLRGSGSSSEWESALSRLKLSQPPDIEDDLRGLYPCLKLSYDNLKKPVAKSLFLLCSLFPEDHEINNEDLIRFGMGLLELGENVDTMEEARREIYVAINILLDSCLLLHSENYIGNKNCVKMHDLVRGVALWVARKEGQAIMVASQAIPRMLVENEMVKDTKVISLWDLKENMKLFDQLHCPTLKILLLHSKKYIKEPDVYLGGMEALRVLALIRSSFDWFMTSSFDWPFEGSIKSWSLPQSIGSLTNLHTLCLRENALGDISFLSSIKGLEILDLRGSSFNELPIGIADMKKLKLLDLFNCTIEKDPYEVIGKCLQLQELHLWDNRSTFPKNLSFPRLQRYVICDSTCHFPHFHPSLLQYVADCVEELRALCLQGCNVSVLSSSMKDLFLRADILFVVNCRWNNKDLNSKVKWLMLIRCPEKKVIFDNPDVNTIQIEQMFCHLVILRLEDMNNLEQVFRDSSIICSLQKLQDLCIVNCPQLHNICLPNYSNLCNLKELRLLDCPMLKSAPFTPTIAQTLVLLEVLYISDCNNLKHMIAEREEEGNADGNSESFLMAFQNLKILSVECCAELESILPLFSARSLLKLRSLTLWETPKLKYVIGGRKDDRVSLYQRNENKSMEIEINMPALTKLHMDHLPELISFFPQQYGPSTMEIENERVRVQVTITYNQLRNQVLPQPLQAFLKLKSLFMEAIQRYKGIFEFEVGRIVDGDAVEEQEPLKLNSELSSLTLFDLPELEFIWKGPTQILSLQRLEEVSLLKCPKLRTIFTRTIITSLPELRRLDVTDCEEWEEIFPADSLKILSASSRNVCLPNLSTIRISNCNKVKWLFSYLLACQCPSLTYVSISDCRELEGVVDGFEGKVGDEGGRHGDHVLFLQRARLNLERLPKLREIFPGFEYNDKLHEIQNCPNIRRTRKIPLE